MSVGDTFTITTTANTNCNGVFAGSILLSRGTVTIDGTSATQGTNLITATASHSIVFTATAAGSTAQLTILDTNTIDSETIFPITVSSGGGGGGSPSSNTSAGPVAAPATMTLQLGEGAGAATCTNGAPVGYTGEWMTLPGSGDCHNTAAPKATLLGWSTTPDFPVAIAQRQSANNWGAYELTDANGAVTAIYIPAGWATFVTGSTNLYPIWNK